MKKPKSDIQKLGYYKRDLKLCWSRSPMKWAAYSRAKVSPGIVKCEKCGKETHWKMVEIDHIKPVQPTDRQISIGEWAARLNCEPEELQVLCYDCHKIKSGGEAKIRRGKRGKA